MSKYTTEVRFICENKSGLDASVGANDVDSVLANSWDKIFTSKVHFFDENYRSVLCQKILKHYYLREICCETVGVWVLWMNTRLEEIMPYYNQLYESELIKFDPMNDVNLKREYKRKAEGETTETRNDSSNRARSTEDKTNNTVDRKSDGTTRDLYSDTPQGAITGLENENYLTNARKVSDSNTDVSKENSTRNVSETEKNTIEGNSNGNSNSTEDYLETLTGKQGTENYSSLLKKFRETFLNIDMQVINQFSDLFMNLW